MNIKTLLLAFLVFIINFNNIGPAYLSNLGPVQIVTIVLAVLISLALKVEREKMRVGIPLFVLSAFLPAIIIFTSIQVREPWVQNYQSLIEEINPQINAALEATQNKVSELEGDFLLFDDSMSYQDYENKLLSVEERIKLARDQTVEVIKIINEKLELSRQQRSWSTRQVSDAQKKIAAHENSLDKRTKQVEEGLEFAAQIIILLRDSEWKFVGNDFTFKDQTLSEKFDALNESYADNLDRLLDTEMPSLDFF